MDNRYTLPDSPYDYAALEPHYSASCSSCITDKHHAAYVAGANTTLEKLLRLERSAISRPSTSCRRISPFIFPARIALALLAQHEPAWWGRADGELAAAIKESFGSVANLKGQLNEAALNVQGSGWGRSLGAARQASRDRAGVRPPRQHRQRHRAASRARHVGACLLLQYQNVTIFQKAFTHSPFTFWYCR